MERDMMEHAQEMEQTINALLAMDVAAQEKLHENQQRRQKMADEVAVLREDIQKRYADEANARIEKIRQDYQTQYDAQMEKLRASYEAALDSLSQSYGKSRGEWVDTIVQRCLR